MQGSAEVLADTLVKLSDEKTKIKIIHSAVGAINESDVLLATASSAIIIGFNVRPDRNAADVAEREKVDIRHHTVIYHVTDEIKLAMAGLLDPTFKEARIGAATVRETFKVPKIGTIAGCMVNEGVIKRSGDAQARLLRDNVELWTGKIASLKRFKDDVGEVKTGFECGIGLQGYNDLKVGDVIEVFHMERVRAGGVKRVGRHGSHHRVERIQEQVREEVSQMLATEVRDPGVGLVTVTRAKVTGDLSLARIYWTIIGDAAERKKTVKALERATGFVRHLLAERLCAAARARGEVHLRRVGRGAGAHRRDHPGNPRRGCRADRRQPRLRRPKPGRRRTSPGRRRAEVRPAWPHARTVRRSRDYMVWVDCEMTGLDPARHVILEIATIITDFDLNIVARGPELAIRAERRRKLRAMDPWPRKTHTRQRPARPRRARGRDAGRGRDSRPCASSASTATRRRRRCAATRCGRTSASSRSTCRPSRTSCTTALST